jgi:hypothetical protein
MPVSHRGFVTERWYCFQAQLSSVPVPQKSDGKPGQKVESWLQQSKTTHLSSCVAGREGMLTRLATKFPAVADLEALQQQSDSMVQPWKDLARGQPGSIVMPTVSEAADTFFFYDVKPNKDGSGHQESHLKPVSWFAANPSRMQSTSVECIVQKGWLEQRFIAGLRGCVDAAKACRASLRYVLLLSDPAHGNLGINTSVRAHDCIHHLITFFTWRMVLVQGNENRRTKCPDHLHAHVDAILFDGVRPDPGKVGL